MTEKKEPLYKFSSTLPRIDWLHKLSNRSIDGRQPCPCAWDSAHSRPFDQTRGKPCTRTPAWPMAQGQATRGGLAAVSYTGQVAWRRRPAPVILAAWHAVSEWKRQITAGALSHVAPARATESPKTTTPAWAQIAAQATPTKRSCQELGLNEPKTPDESRT